jgi:hypothetical protein
MGRHCLDRATLLAVAAGRSDLRTLEALRWHLAGCERCRAGIVAAATGRLRPEQQASRARRHLATLGKLAAVALSMTAVLAALKYDPRAPRWTFTHWLHVVDDG